MAKKLIDHNKPILEEINCAVDINHANQNVKQLFYDKIDNLKFTGKWPSKCKIACCYDGHLFNTCPIPIVLKYNSETSEYVIDNGKVACSGSCAKSFILEENQSNKSMRLAWQFNMMVEYFNWNPLDTIPIAHNKFLLELYGGPMTIEEWRIIYKNLTIRTRNPKFVPFNYFNEVEIQGSALVTFNKQTSTQKQPQKIDEPKSKSEEKDEQKKILSELKSMQEKSKDLLTIHNLKRPDDPNDIIDTEEKLMKKYPNMQLDPPNSVFENWLNNPQFKKPTDEECEQEKVELQNYKKQTRKRKNPISKNQKLIDVAPTRQKRKLVN